MDFIGITLSTLDIWMIATGSLVLAIVFWWLRRIIMRRTLFKLCGVPTSSYQLMGNTLLFPGHSIKLTKDNLHGIPSTVFLKKDGKTAYVCHFINRNFNKRIKVRQRYQMLLFMGIVMDKYKPEKVKGAIRFLDHLESIKFEPVIYNQLLALQNEYNEAIQDWVAPNVRPLFNRDQFF